MPAPDLTFTVSGSAVSGVEGYDRVTVAFSSDLPYTAFECRATRAGDPYGRGVGSLVAAFSSAPAGVERAFDVYDDFLTGGDGPYRVSLYARGEDGSWNDNTGFLTGDGRSLYTSDGQKFLSMR